MFPWSVLVYLSFFLSWAVSGAHLTVHPSAEFPWWYFLVLATLNLVVALAVFFDERPQTSQRPDSGLASFWAATGRREVSMLIVCCFVAYLALTGLSRGIHGMSHRFDDLEEPAKFELTRFVTISWLIWLSLVVLALRALKAHDEGLLYLVFLLRGDPTPRLERRRQGMELRRQERDREQQQENLQAQEEEIRLEIQASNLPQLEAFFAELQALEKVPANIGEFHGYVGDAYQRFLERQKMKSLQVTAERLAAVGALYRAWVNVQRQKAEVVRAFAASKRVLQEVEIDRLEQQHRLNEVQEKVEVQRAREGLEAVIERERLETQRKRLANEQLELEVERLRLERERAALQGSGSSRLAFVHRPLVLGRGDHGKAISLEPPLRERHLYVVGQTRMGKTTLVQNLLIQDMENGAGCAFVDPAGDAVAELLPHIPESRIDDVIYLDFGDPDHLVVFNPLSGPSGQRHGIVEDFCSYLATVTDTDASAAPRMMHILRSALLALTACRRPMAIVHLERFLTDDAFRREIVSLIDDEALQRIWRQQFATLTRAEVQPILTRLSALLAPGSHLRRTFSQTDNKIDFNDIMNRERILLVRLSKGRGREGASLLLGAMILAKLLQEAMARVDVSRGARKPFYLYVDEFHNYEVASFETILAETSKFRLSVTMANQTYHALRPGLRTAIKGNVGTFVAFRIGSEDATSLHPELRRRSIVQGETAAGAPTQKEVWWPSADDLSNQMPHRAYVRLGRPDTVTTVNPRPLPVVTETGRDIERHIREENLRKYYVPIGKDSPATLASGPPEGQFLE